MADETLVEEAGTEQVPAPATTPKSTKDKLRAAKLPTREVEVCLHTELQERYEQLHHDLRDAVARDANDPRLNSGDQRRIARDIEAVQAEMADHVITFRLRSLGRGWSDLLKDHPPRLDNDDDVRAGHNTDTVWDAAIRACTIEPSDMDDDDWTDLLGADGEAGKITTGQYNELVDAVLALNVRRVNLPNSFAASRILRNSDGG